MEITVFQLSLVPRLRGKQGVKRGHLVVNLLYFILGEQ